MHTLVGFEHSTGREMVILVIDLEIILVIICRLGIFAMYNSNSIDNFGRSIRLWILSFVHCGSPRFSFQDFQVDKMQHLSAQRYCSLSQVVPYAISEIHLIPTCRNSLELYAKSLKEEQNCGLILLGGKFLLKAH